MFKNFKGITVTEYQALLSIKLLKISFETGLFQKTFEYAIDKQNFDADTKAQLNDSLKELTSCLELFNNDDDLSEELWNKLDKLNKKMYDIFGLNEEEYYTIAVEFAQANEELAVETVTKQFELIE